MLLTVMDFPMAEEVELDSCHMLSQVGDLVVLISVILPKKSRVAYEVLKLD